MCFCILGRRGCCCCCCGGCKVQANCPQLAMCPPAMAAGAFTREIGFTRTVSGADAGRGGGGRAGRQVRGTRTTRRTHNTLLVGPGAESWCSRSARLCVLSHLCVHCCLIYLCLKHYLGGAVAFIASPVRRTGREHRACSRSRSRHARLRVARIRRVRQHTLTHSHTHASTHSRIRIVCVYVQYRDSVRSRARTLTSSDVNGMASLPPCQPASYKPS